MNWITFNGVANSPQSSYKLIYIHAHSYFLLHFPDVAVRQANWDASKVRDKLRCDINSHALFVRSAKLPEITTSFEVILLSHSHYQNLFPLCGSGAWIIWDLRIEFFLFFFGWFKDLIFIFFWVLGFLEVIGNNEEIRFYNIYYDFNLIFYFTKQGLSSLTFYFSGSSLPLTS